MKQHNKCVVCNKELVDGGFFIVQGLFLIHFCVNHIDDVLKKLSEKKGD